MCSRMLRACSASFTRRSGSVGASSACKYGIHRRLRIDHQALPARQPHHHVGPQRPILRRHVRLLDKIAMLQHPRHLDHAPQLQFTPAPAHPRRPQRVHQVRRLALQTHLHLRQPAHLLLQAAVRLQRAFSISPILTSNFCSVSFTGFTSSSIAVCRFSRSLRAPSWNFSSVACAS